VEKHLLKIKGLWSLIFSVLGFFDSLNKGLPLTPYSLLFATAFGRS
jgi:hypothetical protein